jgi:hypothetical protein
MEVMKVNAHLGSNIIRKKLILYRARVVESFKVIYEEGLPSI